MYRNECCWLFIENVATDVIVDMENEQLNEDQEVGNYFKQAFPELDKAAEDLMNLSIYNPPNSMTLNRYSLS